MTLKISRVLSVVTLLGLVVAGFRYLDADAMLHAWQQFSWPFLALFLLLPVGYLYAKARRFSVLVTHLNVPSKSAVRIGYAASQAASLLPGGIAFRSATMSELGLPIEKTVGPVLLNSALDQFVLLVVGLGAAWWFPQLRFSSLALTALLIVLVGVLSYHPTRERVKRSLLWLAARVKGEYRMRNFFESFRLSLQRRTLGAGLAWSVTANAISLLTLILVVWALALPIHAGALTAAFVVPNLLGRLLPIPAGAGVTEAGMVAFMAHQAGMDVNEAAIATAVFRAVDVLLPALYGFLCYHLWWKRASEKSRLTGQDLKGSLPHGIRG